MDGPAAIKQLTADGEVGVAGAPRTLFTVVLTAGADAATVDLKTGGATGTVLLTVKAAAAGTTFVDFDDGVVFGSGIYVDFTAGTSPVASVAYA